MLYEGAKIHLYFIRAQCLQTATPPSVEGSHFCSLPLQKWQPRLGAATPGVDWKTIDVLVESPQVLTRSYAIELEQPPPSSSCARTEFSVRGKICKHVRPYDAGFRLYADAVWYFG